jgi:hypothetical protein
MRRIAITAVGLVLGGGFYLLLIDTRSLPELYALCGVALLAASAFVGSLELEFTEARFDPRWLRRAWRPLARVPGDVAHLCIDALAQLARRRATRGRFRAVPFAGGASGRDQGRRAVTEILGSLAPNTIVIGIDPERELLLVHQLRRKGGREQLDVLELG